MQNSNPDPSVASATRPLVGLARMTRLAMDGADLAPLRAELIARLERDASDASAWLDLSTLVHLQGDRSSRIALQSEALKRARHFTHGAAGAAPLRLIALMAPGDFMANTPLEFLLEGSGIALDSLYLTADAPLPRSLPEHDVGMVAIAESDANLPLLKRLAASAVSWPRPLINDPDRIASLTRDGFARLMRDAPGVAAPPVTRMNRAQLESLREAVSWPDCPVIIRPVGSHAGEKLQKAERPQELADYLAEVICDDYYVAPFVDYSAADGLFRKYRIALIDSAPFAVHMAVSRHWMVHYLNADMTDNEAHRLEEALFMERFESDFAQRHAAAFRAVSERTGLDYVLLDCAETGAGELLIFEAGTAMIVHALDPVEIYPYKRPQMRKVFAAFADMARRKAAARNGDAKITVSAAVP